MELLACPACGSAGIGCDEPGQISEAKFRAVKWTANDTKSESTGWDFIGTEHFGAFDFALSIETDQALTYGGA